jgi:hypothetical protein
MTDNRIEISFPYGDSVVVMPHSVDLHVCGGLPLGRAEALFESALHAINVMREIHDPAPRQCCRGRQDGGAHRGTTPDGCGGTTPPPSDPCDCEGHPV